MFNFISSFLIVVTVVSLFLILFHDFADRGQPVFLNVVSKAVTVVQSFERFKWKKKVIKMHFHYVLLHISGPWTIHLIGCIFFNKFTTNAFILIYFTCCSFSCYLKILLLHFLMFSSAFSRSREIFPFSSLSRQPKPAVSLTLQEPSSSSVLTDGLRAWRWNIWAAVASERLTLPTLRLL